MRTRTPGDMLRGSVLSARLAVKPDARTVPSARHHADQRMDPHSRDGNHSDRGPGPDVTGGRTCTTVILLAIPCEVPEIILACELRQWARASRRA